MKTEGVEMSETAAKVSNVIIMVVNAVEGWTEDLILVKWNSLWYNCIQYLSGLKDGKYGEDNERRNKDNAV